MLKDLNTKEIRLEHMDYDALSGYLLRHEQDISMGINDFSDLRELFMAVLERDPREINVPFNL